MSTNGAETVAAASLQINAIGRRAGLALQQGRMLNARMHVVRTREMDSKALVAQLRSDPDVEYVVEDALRTYQIVPNDPLYPDMNAVAGGPAAGQWYLRAPSVATPAAIDAEGAWDITTGSLTGPIVAVLDTGVRYEHPDLLDTGSGGKLLPGATFLTNGPRGTVHSNDATDTGDWTNPNECGSGKAATNSSWHGTHVAGLIGALSNTGTPTGMASVGWNVRVLPVRVLAQCGGYDSDIIAAMNWVVGDAVSGLTPLSPSIASQVKVINLSLGSNGACSAAYIDAINNVRSHGAVVVAAAGNSDGQAVGAPANCPGVIAVGGLRHAGTKVGYSAVGPEISLSAPGGNCVNNISSCLYPLISATNTGTQGPNASAYTTSIDPPVGTSFSAPLVSGTAALMMTVRTELQPDDVRRILQDTARAFQAPGGGVPTCHAPDQTVQSECKCTSTTCGAGILDARQAVTAAASAVVPRISVSPANPQPGQTVTLDASGSLPSVGATGITAYHWTLTDGGGIVSSFSGTANSPQISVTPTAAGRIKLTLSVTDDLSAQATTLETVTVTTPTAPSSNSGGGGGASPASLLLLALSAGTLARMQRTK